MPKAFNIAVFGMLQAFSFYGGLGVSVLSVHAESTDSLMPKFSPTYACIMSVGFFV